MSFSKKFKKPKGFKEDDQGYGPDEYEEVPSAKNNWIIEKVTNVKKLDNYKKQMLKQAFLEAEFAGMGKYDRNLHVRARTRLDISDMMMEKLYKVVSEEMTKDRINYIDWYAKGGFLDYYQQRKEIDEMVQRVAIEKLMYELRKPESQQKYYIITAYLKEIRDSNNQLNAIGLSTPLIAQVRAYIDKLEEENRKNSPIIINKNSSYLEHKKDKNSVNNVGLQSKRDTGKIQTTDRTKSELSIDDGKNDKGSFNDVSENNVTDGNVVRRNEETARIRDERSEIESDISGQLDNSEKVF